MENPKIRIESDGFITEVWIDGKKVKLSTIADFILNFTQSILRCIEK